MMDPQPTPQPKSHKPLLNLKVFINKYTFLISLLVLSVLLNAYLLLSKSSNKPSAQKQEDSRADQVDSLKQKNVAIVDSSWIDFSFEKDGPRLEMKYPSGMNVQISEMSTNPDSKVKMIEIILRDKKNSSTNFGIISQPNQKMLPINTWYEDRAKNCAADFSCGRFTSVKPETTIVAGQQALIQYDAKNSPIVDAFIPFGKDKILWMFAEDVTPSSEETKQVFLEMLKTVKITDFSNFQ